MGPRKIAFIGPIPPPIGGVALANLAAQELTAENNPEDLIINYNTSRGLDNADLYKKKGLTEFWHLIKNCFGVLKFSLKHKITVANVFVVPNVSFIREAIFIIFLKLFSKKLVIHLHAKTEGDYFLEGRKLKFFTKILSLGDILFVLSEKFHRQFYAQYIDPKKLVVLENFVDYAKFDNALKHKNDHFLYVGRISEKKGFMTLVDAVIMLHQKSITCTIDVLGEFENEAFRFKVEEKIMVNNISAFNFHGPKFDDEKYLYFQQNGIFVFPSYFENSPIVLKEAIAAKQAIIASDIVENKNILDPYHNKGYFKAKDARSLAEQLEYCISNPTKVKEMQLASQAIKTYDRAVAKKIIAKHI